MPDTPSDIYAQLRRDEGVRLFVYKDTLGNETIGIGHLLANGISEDVANAILLEDVAAVQTRLKLRLPWFENLDPVRQGAMINLAFNLGFNGLEGFPKFLQAAAQGNYEDAATELLSSQWRQQVGARAVRLAQQMVTGQWV